MLRIEGLTKRYGRHTVVDDLTFDCAPGQVLGFLGPNGAGKSTTMKMVTGFVTPDAGTASVGGHDIRTDTLAAQRMIGYLPEGAPLYAEMTPGRFLNFVADVRGLTGEHRQNRLREVIERLHLSPVLGQTIDTLSKGFKRRVGLAQAILHDPKVLILDEPTDGLDPNQKYEVRELIRSMSADKLIVISTHILEEVDAVCGRAIIISEGRILADESPADLVAKSRHHNAVTITLSAADRFDEIRAAIEKLPSVATTEAKRELRRITAMPKAGSGQAATLQAVSDLAAAERWPVDGIELERGRLDEVFRDITTRAAA